MAAPVVETLRLEDDFALARVEGVLDARTREALRPLVEAVDAGGTPRLLLDLSGAERLESAGLSPLLRISEALAARGGGLALVRVSDPVHRLLRGLPLDAWLPVFPDAEAALRAIEVRPLERLTRPTDPFAPRPPGETFRVTVEAGAVMPTGRRQTLRLDQSGRVLLEQRNTNGRPEHVFYAGDVLIGWLSAWVATLVDAGSGGASDERIVDGDFVTVHAEHQERAVRRSAVNAYDPVLCPWLATVLDALPETVHIAYSRLRQASLEL